jgi:hypothetical protein
MAIFTLIATSLLAGTFLAGSTIAIGALAIGLGVATQIGLSYALKAISGNQTQPAAAVDHFGVQGQIAGGGDVPRSFPLGYSATAGSLVYANTWGNDGETPNAYLTQVVALSDLPGPRLAQVWVSGELCTLGGVLDSNVGAPVLEYRKDGNDHVWVKFYDGTQTTADPLLVNTVASIDRPYPATRVGTGVAYAVCTSLVEDTLFTGFPTFKFALSGIPLYDVSKDTTAGGSGSQRYSDPSTWGGDGDDFPAVQVYNILRGFYCDGVWLYGLQNMTAARLPAVNWITQIAKCRTPIEGDSGDEPTYRAGMQLNINAQPVNAITALLTACQGKVSEIGGSYKIHLGAPDSPSFSFTDADILSSEPQTFRPFFALADSVNGIQATYPDPSQGWNTATAPAYYRTDLEAKDGNRRLMANPAFDACPYPAQVQRLQKSAIEEGQRARTHTIVLPPVYWVVEPGEVGEWTSTRNGYAAKQFRVDGAIDKANLDAGLSVTEVDPADYDWDHGTEYRPVTTGPTVFPRPAPQGILDWFAEGIILRDGGGLPRRPAIRLAWNGDMPGVDGVQFEVRNASDQLVVSRGRTDQLGAGALIISQSLLPAFDYQARGQYLPSAPRDVLWSDWLDVTTPDVRISIEEFDEALRNQVTAVTDAQNDKIEALNQRMSTLVSALGAGGWTDIKSVRSQLFATAGTANARIEEVRTVAVDAQSAVATLSESVSATFGPDFSEVSTVSSAVATLDGYAAARWSVAIDVNGNVVGLVLINDSDDISAFTVTVDKFQVAFPGHAGGTSIPVFTIANVNGVAKIALRGDMLVDGDILTRHLSAGAVTTITLDAQAVTAAKIKAGDITSDSGVIGALGVKSLSIGDNAVTVPQVSSSSSAFSPAVFPSVSDALSFTMSINTTGLTGKSIAVLISFTTEINDFTVGTDNLQLRLMAAGSLLSQASLAEGTDAPTLTLAGAYFFTASGGTDTVAVSVSTNMGSSSAWTLGRRILSAVAAKR